jgi:putative Ca2+/H+ antiporter (TMEM165/GDT1 family)
MLDENVHNRFKLLTLWLIFSVISWLLYLVAKLLSAPLHSHLLSTIGLSEDIIVWIVLFTYIVFPISLGYLHWKALKPTKHGQIEWMIAYVLAMALGSIVGMLISSWIFPDRTQLNQISYGYSQAIPVWVGQGLGIGIAQSILLRNEFQFPYLFILGSTIGIVLAYGIADNVFPIVAFRIPAETEYFFHAATLGILSNLWTGILLSTLNRKPVPIHENAA